MSTFSVTNIDEPGTVRITGTLSGGSTLTASVTDIDGTVSNLTWQWAGGARPPGPSRTSAGRPPLATTVADDVRTTASYDDPQSRPSDGQCNDPIGASNSEPTFSSNTATRTLPENSVAGVNVVGGTIAATESDNGDTLTYGLSERGRTRVLRPSTRMARLKTKTGVTHNFNFESTKKAYT